MAFPIMCIWKLYIHSSISLLFYEDNVWIYIFADILLVMSALENLFCWNVIKITALCYSFPDLFSNLSS